MAFIVGVTVILRFVIVVLWDMSPLTRLSGLLMICLSVYTVRSKSFRTDFFKNRRHMRKTHTLFFIKNKLHWHIYRLLRSRTVSEKLPKIRLFGPSLIHQ